MKVVVFGVGEYYQNRKSKLEDNSDIVAYLDNNPDLWGESIDGVKIYAPSDIHKFSYEAIVLMSLKAHEMKRQLLEMGIEEAKIFYYDKFYGYMHKGEIEYYYGDNTVDNAKEQVLIVTRIADYSGSALAAIYAARALKELRYSVSIASYEIYLPFIEEMQKKGYNFIVYRNLLYAEEKELEWMNSFKYIICNTLPMIHCVKVVGAKKKVIWWLHECRSVGENIKNEFSNIKYQDFFNTFVWAVGNRCKNIFNDFYPQVEVNIMPLGIPDVRKWQYKKSKEKVIFIIIGGITPLKSQQIFLEAVSKLSEEEKKRAEFWVVGNIPNSFYANRIREMASKEAGVKLLGIKSRKEIERLYSIIDVVVCASKEETGPIVIVEGMMYGKVCITTDTTEMASYIVDGQSGFVCETQNAHALYEKMKWVINHREALNVIGNAARKVYEENFTINKLGQRLQESLLRIDS